MKVLVVTTWYPSDESPQAAGFIERDVELLSRTHVVHVVHLSATLSPHEDRVTETRNGIAITRVAMSPASPIQMYRAARYLRSVISRFDMVHTMALSALLPFVFARVPIPWVHTEHWSGLVAPETIPASMRATLPLTSRLLRKPAVVVAVSTFLAHRIASVRNGPIVVIPNYVMQPEALAERRVNPDVLQLVSVGGLVPLKGPDIAVRVIAELRDRGTPAKLVWIGDGPMRENAANLAMQLGVAHDVNWAGPRDRGEVSRALDESDLFLLPTKSETFGVSIAEALAHGRPVVVGAIGGQSDYVRPPFGALVAERSPRAYADAVIQTMQACGSSTAQDIATSVRSQFSDTDRQDAYADAYARAGASS